MLMMMMMILFVAFVGWDCSACYRESGVMMVVSGGGIVCNAFGFVSLWRRATSRVVAARNIARRARVARVSGGGGGCGV